MKTQLTISTLALSMALSVALVACAQSTNQPQTMQSSAENSAEKSTEISSENIANTSPDIGFSTSKYQFTMPKDIEAMCENDKKSIEQNTGERPEEDYQCITIDLDVVKTKFAWIDKILGAVLDND